MINLPSAKVFSTNQSGALGLQELERQVNAYLTELGELTDDFDVNYLAGPHGPVAIVTAYDGGGGDLTFYNLGIPLPAVESHGLDVTVTGVTTGEGGLHMLAGYFPDSEMEETPPLSLVLAEGVGEATGTGYVPVDLLGDDFDFSAITFVYVYWTAGEVSGEPDEITSDTGSPRDCTELDATTAIEILVGPPE